MVTFARFSVSTSGDKRCRTSIRVAARRFVLSRTKPRTSTPHSLKARRPLPGPPSKGARFIPRRLRADLVPEICATLPRNGFAYEVSCLSAAAAGRPPPPPSAAAAVACSNVVLMRYQSDSPYSVARARYHELVRPPAAHLLSTARHSALWALLLKGGRGSRTRDPLDSFKRVGCSKLHNLRPWGPQQATRPVSRPLRRVSSFVLRSATSRAVL